MWNCSTKIYSKHRPGYQLQTSFDVTMPHFLKYNVMGGAGLKTVLILQINNNGRTYKIE